MWPPPQRRAHSFSKFARVSQTEGGLFPKCGFRLNAAHIRFEELYEIHGLRAGRSQNVALALASRTIASKLKRAPRIPISNNPEMAY
eukprot:6331512-Pyramimonas_sp.AAC.1